MDQGQIAVEFGLLKDRLEAQDVLYRYCSSVDAKDFETLRRTVSDDFVGIYGNNDPVRGGDEVVRWIDDMTAGTIWQHHLISVYSVDIRGDSASALSYHTSHQMFETDPDVVHVIIGRYHDQLVRSPEGWRIKEKLMEVIWAGERRDPNNLLGALGGRKLILSQ